MDHAAYHVIYLDTRVKEDRCERRNLDSSSQNPLEWKQGLPNEPDELKRNLEALTSTFRAVHLCSTGLACLKKIRELDSIASDCTPTIVFLEIYADVYKNEHRQRSLVYPTTNLVMDHYSQLDATASPENFNGFVLLRHIKSEMSHANISKLIVPIVMLRDSEGAGQGIMNNHSVQKTSTSTSASGRPADGPSLARQAMSSSDILKFLEAGAVDIVTSPLLQERIEALSIHGYRAHIQGLKEQSAFVATKRQRKRSWVGVDEERPFAYLRESMVSDLMNSICKPESLPASAEHDSLYIINPSREIIIARSIGSWAFAAHDFSDDELIHAAFLILQHALEMPDLERWRIPAEEIKTFLIACRSAYNSFVLYHNFRHVIDVLQAVFFFLLQIGTLPPWPSQPVMAFPAKQTTPIAALLKPFEALILLVSAIGHDVGHPGVNNAFLVALKAPLAQLYNDNSVLEAFHCAAYSQILRRHWTVVFEDCDLRRLLIKSILATDMQLHFKYMTDLGNLQERLHHNEGTDGWSDKVLEEYKTLVCGLLIKCADISNVARPFGIASKWADILQLEFAKQGEMERDVGIPTTLFGGPPELGNITKLAVSQISFMNIFACPLFESVTDVLPSMHFAVDEIRSNQKIWKEKIESHKAGEEGVAEEQRYKSEPRQSPRSGSPDRNPATFSKMSHPEGLPASTQSSMTPLQHTTKVLQNTRTPPDTSRCEDETISSTAHSAKLLQPSTPTYTLTNGQKLGNMQAQLQLGSLASVPPDLSTNENALADDYHASTSPFNEAVFIDNSSTSTAAGTRSSSGGGGAGSSYRGDKSLESDTSNSQRAHSGNFSRPLSTRHSAHASYARSSAPSATPTLASTYLPTSPTNTQATSFFTEGSDGTTDVADPTEVEQLGGPYPTENDLGNRVRSPTGRGAKIGIVDGIRGHVEANRSVHKKGSRFRLDFWKKKRPGEVIGS